MTRPCDSLRGPFWEGRSMNGLHADADLEPLWGYEPFEQLIRPRG